MFNTGWRRGPPQQTQVHIERVYDRTSGRELTRAEAGCAKEIERLKRDIEETSQQLSDATHENVRLGEKLAIAESIESEIIRVATLSHNDNPYPKTRYTSEYLKKQLADFCALYKIQVAFPKEFLCPITHEVMAYPVTTSQGHTYEWETIAKWFKAGNSKDPLSGKSLNNVILYPNHELRSLILTFIRNCRLIIKELRKKEVLEESTVSKRVRSAPTELRRLSRSLAKTNIRIRSRLDANSKSKTRSKPKPKIKTQADYDEEFDRMVTRTAAARSKLSPSDPRYHRPSPVTQAPVIQVVGG